MQRHGNVQKSNTSQTSHTPHHIVPRSDPDVVTTGQFAIVEPKFTTSRTGRYILYAYIPQEYIDRDDRDPPLWYRLYDVVEKRIIWDKQFVDDEYSWAGGDIFKFGPDDQYILLHGTHIIDVKTGDFIYIWRGGE